MRMLQGVVVDDLTEQFLGVATDNVRGRELYQILRVFFHDARNRLNSLKIGLYLARRTAHESHRGLWTELEQSYQGLERLVERLQAVLRDSEIAPVAANIGPWLEERRYLWSSWLGAKGRSLEWVPPDSPVFGCFDPMRLVQGLDALVSWRSGEGIVGETCRLSWRDDANQFLIEWTEEGSTVPEPLEGREGRSVSMVLPMLAHIMAAHGGSLFVMKRDGLVVRLSWPREPVSSTTA
jgi:hypothetical protein